MKAKCKLIVVSEMYECDSCRSIFRREFAVTVQCVRKYGMQFRYLSTLFFAINLNNLTHEMYGIWALLNSYLSILLNQCCRVKIRTKKN